MTPQHPFYKDNMEECKRRWKQLQDSFVKNKNKTVPSGSAGGSQKDWKYSNNMSFLLPHLQPRSSKSTLRPIDLCEDTPAELMCEEDDLTAGPSGLPSRPGTPATPTLRSTSSSPHPTDVGLRSTHQLSELPRSATPPTHPRMQALSSGAETHTTQPGRKKRKGSTTAGPLEPDLLDILTTEETPVPLHVPKDEEEMYFFALSLVPRLNRLPRSTQARAQIHILQYLTDLEKEEQDKLTQASPSVTRPTPLHWQQTTQPQSSGFQGYSSTSNYQQGHTPPLTTYQGPAQPPSQYQQGPPRQHINKLHNPQCPTTSRDNTMQCKHRANMGV
ncbi:uncharacterized protein LOC144458772 [Epinephelus lanceolatus]